MSNPEGIDGSFTEFPTPSSGDSSLGPFWDPFQKTMARLVEDIRGDAALSDVRRRNLASSIRRFCQALGYDAAQVPANHWHFRQRLKRFHPLTAGLTVKRWQTIKADVGFALRHAGITAGQPRGLSTFTPEWRSFREQLPQGRLNWGLSRLGRYCSGLGIAPAGVTDQLMADFLGAMRAETFKTNPDHFFRGVCVSWNQAARALPALGLVKVSVPSFRDNYTLPWEDLPAGLRTEADAWLATMSKEADLLSDEGPIKPLRPNSIKTYRFTIRLIHAALVAKGLDPASINSLRTLILPANAKLALKFFLDRNKGKTSSQVHGVAHVLVLIATTTKLADAAIIEQLKRYRAQLAVKRTGLSDRPREALAQFADRGNIEKILCLPLQIYRQLSRKSAWTKADARLMQVAVALECLLMRPIRRNNIASLRLDESLLRVGKEILIRLPAEEVKNAVDLDYKLPRESAQLLTFYIDKLLPLLGPNPMRWLFPGEDPQRSKCPEQFARQFIRTIREKTGLYLYPHLTRHLAAFLYLKENPGNFEVVRRVLAHRSLTTTTRSYAGFDDQSAVELYDRVVLRIRDEIAHQVSGENTSV